MTSIVTKTKIIPHGKPVFVCEGTMYHRIGHIIQKNKKTVNNKHDTFNKNPKLI